MDTKALRFLTVFLILEGLLALAISSLAMAQCSENEMTAVFMISGMDTLSNLQLETLTVFPVGEATYPSNESVISAICDIQSGYYYRQSQLVGSFNQFFATPGDEGGVAIADTRDGAIVFAGTIIWMGTGAVTIPVVSSHEWIEDIGCMASEPDSLGIMEYSYKGEMSSQEEYDSKESITESVLAYLRQTDVLNSFAECGPYNAILYYYYPSTGGAHPELAKCVVVVSGLCGPPWNTPFVGVEHRSLGGVRGLFQ